MNASLAAAVLAARRDGVTTFGLPAHGPGHHVPPLAREALSDVFAADAFSPKGIDDRTESAGVMDAAQDAAANAWGAEACRFSTGGATQGIQSAIMATCRPGGTLILSAGEHKSAHAMIAAMDLLPVFLPPAVDAVIGAEHGVHAEDLRAALASHPDAGAVLVNAPSYYGTAPDIATLADVAHGAGVPLIADEAWGAHFAFSDALPTHALAQGADITVTSLHKTMGALAQGAAVFRQGRQVDPHRFEDAWDALQSSSHSTPIAASIDATRADYEAEGAAHVARAIGLADEVRDAAREAGLAVLDESVLDGGAIHALDRTKVALGTAPWGANGIEVEDWMTARYGLYLGMSDAGRLEAGIGPGTTPEAVARLCEAIRAAGEHRRWDGPPDGMPGYDALTINIAMRPAEARSRDMRFVPLTEAVGEVCAELVIPYPPGVPRLMPGQRIEPVHVAFLEGQRAMGALVKGQADTGLERLRVVA